MKRDLQSIQFLIRDKYCSYKKGSIVKTKYGKWELNQINEIILLGEEVGEEGSIQVYATAYKLK